MCQGLTMLAEILNIPGWATRLTDPCDLSSFSRLARLVHKVEAALLNSERKITGLLKSQFVIYMPVFLLQLTD